MSEERRKFDRVVTREDKDGYMFTASRVRPIGRLFATIALTPQYQIRCMNVHHSGCQKWISSKRAHPDRLKLWVVEGMELPDQPSHLRICNEVVKPL